MQPSKHRSIVNTDTGIRSCLEDHQRCATSSDEAANTFETKFSDKDSGINYLRQAKLNTWTREEYDSMMPPQAGTGKQAPREFTSRVAGCSSMVGVISLSSGFRVSPKPQAPKTLNAYTQGFAWGGSCEVVQGFQSIRGRGLWSCLRQCTLLINPKHKTLNPKP